jgi:hypothetical protein
LLFKIFHVKISEDGYEHVPEFVRFFLFVWGNSIGNINDPDYSEYSNKINDHPFPAGLMITLIWITWIFN